MSDEIRIASLHRYPLKGLSPEPLEEAQLSAGRHFPGDRLFAIENGPSGFDAAAPAHQPKIKFLMLMRNERLAQLRTRYDDAAGTLTIHAPDRPDLVADLGTVEGRASIEAFFAGYMRYELRGSPRVLTAPDGFRFTDTADGFVSLINLASVRALEEIVGAPVDPLRFRANLYVEGLDPWEEFSLIGETLSAPSGARLVVESRIDRCAATNVDPTSGLRDLEIPKSLMRSLGHIDCGVFLRVKEGGLLRAGDTLR